MRQRSGRLPTHFLFDIDGTLLHPCTRRALCDTDTVLGSLFSSLARDNRGSPTTHDLKLYPISYDRDRISHVLLRPHILPFLEHLLLRRCLDTDETETHVSLYTRQSASYCRAVVEQVLLPALRESAVSSDAVCRDLFYGLYSAEHCVQGDTGTEQASPGGEASTLSSTAAATRAEASLSQAWGSGEWTKTVALSPSPCTTALVDDSWYNFRPAELRSGHAILVPPFHPDTGDFTVDARFSVSPQSSRETEECFYDALLKPGALTADDTATTKVLSLLETFVHVCRAHREQIEQLQRTLAWPQYRGGNCESMRHTRALDQQVLLHRLPSCDAVLDSCDFFELSPRYRTQWSEFHEGESDKLHLWLQ